MSERSENKAVECSCRLFRRLLVAYPKAHREEYGPAILQLFRDQCRDAWAAARVRGLLGFWLRALGDLLKTSVLEHLSNANRRKSMLSSFRPQSRLLVVFCTVFAAVFLLAVGGSIVLTLLYPKTYASSANLLIAYVAPAPSSGPPYKFPISEFQVIQSHAVLSQAIETLNLVNAWNKKYNNGQPLNELQVEALIRSRLQLSSARNSDLIEIRAFSDSPNDAAKLANAVAQAYRGFHQEQLTQNATAPFDRRVIIIRTAVPEPRAVRPNTPLNIVVGVMIGVLVGTLSGTIAIWVTWFIGRLPENSGGSRRPASSDIPA